MTTPVPAPAPRPVPTSGDGAPDDPPLTLTVRSPEDLLALVPVVLGFGPEESVVLLTFGAQRPFHARVDLPDVAPDHAEAWHELARVLLEPATRHRAERVAVLVYTADPARAVAAWRRLREGCRDRHLPVMEAMRVEPTRYYPFLGDRRLRETGVPHDVAHHPFLVQSVVSGRVTHASRAALAETLAPDPVGIARVEPLLAGLDVWEPRVPPPTGVLLREGAWVHDLVGDHARAGTEPDDADLARLLRSMAALRVRDAAWSAMRRPTAREHRELWTRVLRRTPPPWVAPVATLLGWAAWLSGDGALAWCALDRAGEADPDYSLAELLGQMLLGAAAPADFDLAFDWTEGLVA